MTNSTASNTFHYLAEGHSANNLWVREADGSWGDGSGARSGYALDESKLYACQGLCGGGDAKDTCIPAATDRVAALKDTVHREMFEKTKGTFETLATYHYANGLAVIGRIDWVEAINAAADDVRLFDVPERVIELHVARMRDMVGLNRQINRADSFLSEHH